MAVPKWVSLLCWVQAPCSSPIVRQLPWHQHRESKERLWVWRRECKISTDLKAANSAMRGKGITTAKPAFSALSPRALAKQIRCRAPAWNPTPAGFLPHSATTRRLLHEDWLHLLPRPHLLDSLGFGRDLDNPDNNVSCAPACWCPGFGRREARSPGRCPAPVGPDKLSQTSAYYTEDRRTLLQTCTLSARSQPCGTRHSEPRSLIDC